MEPAPNNDDRQPGDGRQVEAAGVPCDASRAPVGNFAKGDRRWGSLLAVRGKGGKGLCQTRTEHHRPGGGRSEAVMKPFGGLERLDRAHSTGDIGAEA